MFRTSKLSCVLSVLGLSFFLVFFVLYSLVFYTGVHKKILEENKVYETFGKDRADYLYSNIISYFKGKENLVDEFEPEEKSHLADVKQYFVIIKYALLSSFILFLIPFFSAILQKQDKKQLFFDYVAIIFISS